MDISCVVCLHVNKAQYKKGRSFSINIDLTRQLIKKRRFGSVSTDLDDGQALLAALFNKSLFIYLLSIKVL